MGKQEFVARAIRSVSNQAMPVVLVILDGFGLRPEPVGNAIIQAKTPFFDYLTANHSAIALQAAGEAVGLPWGEMGNSEVGHLNMGSGRVVLQDYPQISRAIKDGSFFANPALLAGVEYVKKNNSKLHFLGLVSKGAVHSHIDHLYGLLELAKRAKLKKVYIHAILDGRDAPAKSAPQYLEPLVAWMGRQDIGRIATLVGRYFAMDRDKRFDRTKKCYDALVLGLGEPFTNPLEAIQDQYKHGQSDEFMPPLILDKESRISANDAVVFFNFRADRALQLTKTFVDPGFAGFKRPIVKNLKFVTLTNYEHNLPVDVCFGPLALNNPTVNPLTHCLAQVVSEQNFTQLHIAETEKYAHITYFFNAGQAKEFRGETRVLVASPKVATYDQAPEMSAQAVAAAFAKEFDRQKSDLTVINFANADMVGHTGNLPAAIKAIQALDRFLAQVVGLASERGACVLITGDHGNAEQMIDPSTGLADKEHTINPVPLIIVDKPLGRQSFSDQLSIDEKIRIHGIRPLGIFADIAPTVLDYLALPAPSEMTGTSLKNII